MSKAVLTYTINSNDPNNKRTLTLESGSLFYIDSCTKTYADSIELKKSFLYRNKIIDFSNQYFSNNGKFNVEYIRNNSYKEILPVLLNDDKPIFRHDDFYNNQKSEIEVTRKLLHNSKNKMFLKSFLKCKKLYNTTNFLIKMTYSEYLDALDKKLSVIMNENGYYINVNDLLKYVTETDKLGKLRPLFDDSLETWKKKVNKFNEEGIYYYSRNLRVLINEYNKKVKTKKIVTNLNVNDKNINRVFNHNRKNKENSVIEINDNVEQKQKILTDEKIA